MDDVILVLQLLGQPSHMLTMWTTSILWHILLPQEFVPIFLWTVESGRRMWQHGGTVSRENSSQPLPPSFLQCHKTKSVTQILGMRAYWSAKLHTLLIPVLWTTSLLATHPGWGIISVFYLPLAPLANAFIVVEGVTVLVHWVVGQVHETLVLRLNRHKDSCENHHSLPSLVTWGETPYAD